MTIIEPTLQDVVQYANSKVSEYRQLNQQYYDPQAPQREVLDSRIDNVGRFFSKVNGIEWNIVEFGHFSAQYFHRQFVPEMEDSNPSRSLVDLACRFGGDGSYVLELSQEYQNNSIDGTLAGDGKQSIFLSLHSRRKHRLIFGVTQDGKYSAQSNLSVVQADSILRLFFEDILGGRP
ncbi:hypothetical protein HYV86_07855 [Candidatus Woesearchaeota archaeon]|nr:hypothetical protein [Candidatus Woesearchaeota archaeon]